MKIGILNAQDWNERRGGGELSIKYWYEIGIQQGHDIEMITNSSDNHHLEFDFYLISNFPEFTDKKYLISIIESKKHAFLMTSSIRWPQFEHLYDKASFFITMAPDHATHLGLDERPHFYTPPYIDSTIFKPAPPDKFIEDSYKSFKNVQLYLGLIHPLKIPRSMFKYIVNHPEIEFHFYGQNKFPKFPHYDNVHFFPEITTEEDVASTMQIYKTFFWYLNRYGCYGRTIVEALLCGMEMNVNKENFGLFKYPWINGGPEVIRDNLEFQLKHFWEKVLDRA